MRWLQQGFNSFHTEFKLLMRGIKLVNKTAHGIFFYAIAGSLCSAALPYVAVFFSAIIITKLNERAFAEVYFYVVATLVVSFILSILKHIFSQHFTAKMNYLKRKHELLFNEKSYDLSFQKAESASIHAQKEQILNDADMFLFGLTRIPKDINSLFEGLLSILIAFFMMNGILSSHDTAAFVSNHWILSSMANVSFILCICLLLFVSFLFRNKAAKNISDRLVLNGRFNNFGSYYQNQYLDDSKAAKDIRILGQKEFILNVIKKFSVETLWNVNKTVNKIQLHSNMVTTSVVGIGGGIVYLFVGLKALYGFMPLGNVVRYAGTMTQLLSSFSKLFNNLISMKANNHYIEKAFAFLDIENENGEQHNSIPFSNGTICFQNVTFRYPESQSTAVNQVSFQIHKGEKIAIVGENGSGKTTLIKLLCRLYPCSSGEIQINDINIEKLPLDSYRKLFSVVFQDFHLFSFPIGENVAVSSEYEESRVWDALRMADIENKVKSYEKGLEQALYKQFDESGIDISGGEEQKIAAARTFFKNGDIIVLDEPTAALDPFSEYKLFTTLNHIIKNKTTIFISHRLSSCRFCDRIAVMDQGNLVQFDTHKNLLKDTHGKYYQIWNAQARYYTQ